MLKLGAFGAIVTLLLWWPNVAHEQKTPADNKHSEGAQTTNPVPPAHVIVEPSPANQLKDAIADPRQRDPQEKPLPRFARPEWVIVYITAVYVLIAGLTLKAIKRQADWMKEQTARMARQADLMKRQNVFARESLAVARETADAAKESADAATANAESALAQINAMKSKERAKLSFELDPFSPHLYFRSSPWAQTVRWRVRLHGQSEAWELQCPAILCVGEPSDHPFFGLRTLNLPPILSPAQREYSGALTLHFADRNGKALGEDTLAKLERGEATLFFACSIGYSDVYGDRWILPIRLK